MKSESLVQLRNAIIILSLLPKQVTETETLPKEALRHD